MRASERVYLGVGSNLGDRQSLIEKAQSLVRTLPGTQFLKSSSLFETDPVGGPPQGKFLNAVWEIETALSPDELKKRLHEIEIKLGRKRHQKNDPREIDLDILFYGDRVIDGAGLQIPHPRLQERTFVLLPLAELAPELKHPILKKKVKELLAVIARSPNPKGLLRRGATKQPHARDCFGNIGCAASQ